MGGRTIRDAVIRPLSKETLADRLARQIRGLIQRGEYKQGDRLPTIMEMARQFGVGHPTIREALKTLETMRVVEIRHGSGVYVTRSEDVLVLASRDYAGTVTKELLLDLIQTRLLLEVHSVSCAVVNATNEHLREMRRLLGSATQNLGNDDVLQAVNTAFHRQIAAASGNTVLAQMLDVLHDLFVEEQGLILRIFGSRERDHEEHLAILESIELRDEALAVERMRTHLEGIRDAVQRWDPVDHPVN
ncbi:MAG TPA: FadR/GntR family transcriptional regulator [Gemmatimonadaceae bacterium]|nr:FadR/GntR family transcriptional regulator [Gemmatimonadaceae bacterium]